MAAVSIRAIETYFQPPGPPGLPNVTLYDDAGKVFVELKSGVGTYPRYFGTVARAEWNGRSFYPPADSPKTFGDLGASVAVEQPVAGKMGFLVLGYDNVYFVEKTN